jgi:hypothetical protein
MTWLCTNREQHRYIDLVSLRIELAKLVRFNLQVQIQSVREEVDFLTQIRLAAAFSRWGASLGRGRIKRNLGSTQQTPGLCNKPSSRNNPSSRNLLACNIIFPSFEGLSCAAVTRKNFRSSTRDASIFVMKRGLDEHAKTPNWVDLLIVPET